MDLAEGFRRRVRAALGLPSDSMLPAVDRMALYRAEVKSASSDGATVDVAPDDSRLPTMQKVKVRVGIPGAVAVVQPGAVVLIGWERGDPSRPYAVPAWENGATVTKLILNATEVYIGAEGGAGALVKKSDFDSHTHLVGAITSPAGACTGNSGAPTAPTPGTTKLKAV